MQVTRVYKRATARGHYYLYTVELDRKGERAPIIVIIARMPFRKKEGEKGDREFV